MHIINKNDVQVRFMFFACKRPLMIMSGEKIENEQPIFKVALNIYRNFFKWFYCTYFRSRSMITWRC